MQRPPFHRIACAALLLCSTTTAATAQSSRPALRTRDPASVQFMITNDMRQALQGLGYSDADIDALVPERAAVIIDNGIACPARGVPSSWKRGGGRGRKQEGNGLVSKVFSGLTRLGAFSVATALALHFSGLDLGELSVYIDKLSLLLLESTRAH
jgi:hypothetical protein